MFTNILKPPLPRQPGDHILWGELQGSAASLALSHALDVKQGVFLAITVDNASAQHLYAEVNFFKSPEQEVLLFPDWETLPYDAFSPHEDIISDRLTVLARLPQLQCGILIVPITSLMYPVIPRNYLEAHSLVLTKGQRLERDVVRQNLVSAGYRAVEQVLAHGEFALRGAIIDLFPMGSQLPYRLDLLDDEIDSIRTFDPHTQRSIATLTEVKLLPAKEYPLTETSIAHFRQAWREEFTGRPMECPVYEAVSQGLSPSGIEYYLPLFYEKCDSLFDYLPQTATVIQFSGTHQAAQHFWQEIEKRYEQYRHDVQRPLLSPHKLFMPVPQVFQLCKQYGQISIQAEAVELRAGAYNFATQTIPDLAFDTNNKTPLSRFQTFLLGTKQAVLITAESAGRREALLEILKGIQVSPQNVTNWREFLESPVPVGITVGYLEKGLSLNQPSVVLLTEAQLYGQRILQRRHRKDRPLDEENFIRSLVELVPGVPVVHIEHGVGRYQSLETITTAGIKTEFVTLLYANNTKLYVPVADLHLLSRYSGGDADHAPLHALGSDQWSKAKQKAAERARDVAAELLDLYARRAARPGRQCVPADQDYETFAASFAYEETPDQQKAIHDVLSDMTKTQCMDRLVCGDVGFGKTEVAMRAAFLAVQNDYQVAVLVPTTLLAEQHYNNFKERFVNWPVTIELISRFRTSKQQTEVLKKLAAGTVDIIIGTHKLLQENIGFANLGLLIIDEEHRFGVKQKERLKALRTDVHILTLTATPIPRTLNMSLSGIRELSLITTPPAKRLSIKTFVQKRDNRIIREAILREVLRGGQVFFLHNDVATIEQTRHALSELVPEAKMTVGHGQMSERDLERVMADFYHQRFNVLVCTTIIETGIDIPSANTIIMDRADKLGLAQLHQLRGRVGRSHHQAYAYLLIPDPKSITPDAEKRLDAIVATEELGGGFILASNDLEIRGAGELLGEEQSGHIATVGFSLYLEFLDKAITALKAGKQPDFSKPFIEHTEIDLHLSAIIPDDYIPDVSMRLVLYKRIAAVKNENDIRALQIEMIDRFGLLPIEVKNLFQLADLRLRMQALGIAKIQADATGGTVEFLPEPKIDPLKLIQLIQKFPQFYKLQGSKKLTFMTKSDNAESRFAVINRLLDTISQQFSLKTRDGG
jgi:transcription-repair coupling factor (superfamily II helicase)